MEVEAAANTHWFIFTQLWTASANCMTKSLRFVPGVHWVYAIEATFRGGGGGGSYAGNMKKQTISY